ncbi:hypothetical protein SAMN05877842_102144 [Ureibacillus acetophenoni]|uniref:Uncharacterized protein n=1 Tax=Ureibacillus acetophenoni TaxID=614649 RepID=A0A285U6M4_9BACL|nr:hypothetical protein SAMN05877842_102144 [Ureibacillus acetophenoni]
MNRGYASFYKGHYLRSSYEYAYAKYLDYHSIPWGYEVKVFDLGYKFYGRKELLKFMKKVCNENVC